MTPEEQKDEEKSAQIKELMEQLTFDDIAEELLVFIDLVLKHHPSGISIFEVINEVYGDKRDPIYRDRLPNAIDTFKNILNDKYKDNKMETAILIRTINEVLSLDLSHSFQ